MERIHRANLVNFGIVPLVFDDQGDYDLLKQGDAIDLSGLRAAVAGDGRLAVKLQDGRTVILVASLSARERELLLCGGLLASLGGRH